MASNSLNPERRAKLLEAIQKMEVAGESQEYIQGVVDHYKAKYAGPAAPQKPLDMLQYMPAIPFGPTGGLTMAQAVDAAPNALGATGGILAGVPGALYGGAIGEGYRQGMRKLADPSMAWNPNAIAEQGIKQGALQGAGAVLGAGAIIGSKAIGPAARLAGRAIQSPVVKTLLPLAGYGAHRIEGAMAGVAAPYLGKAALSVATSPRTEAFLGSMAFRSFARHFPQAANQIIQQLKSQ